jgi:hypothetical protein
MKVAKFTKELIPRKIMPSTLSKKEEVELQKLIKKGYKELTWIPTADNLHDKGFHDWMRIKKGKIGKYFREKDRQGYEAFVQGYLWYFEKHDSMISSHEDRTLYFDWGKTRDDCDLIIYLKPLFMKNYHDYKDPASPFPSPYPPPPSTIDPPPTSQPPPPTRY